MAAAVANLERARLVGDREMAINRIFDAPRDRVFAAWIDPEAIGQWCRMTDDNFVCWASSWLPLCIGACK
jgi:hypothetical protein